MSLLERVKEQLDTTLYLHHTTDTLPLTQYIESLLEQSRDVIYDLEDQLKQRCQCYYAEAEGE